MVELNREQRFIQSLRDWGQVFMLTIWLQSIMTSAITTKITGRSRRVKELSKKYREKRNDLMKKGLPCIWKEFVREFPGEISTEESLTSDMIILIRNQLAHFHISTRNEFALFLPNSSSRSRLDKLKSEGWVEAPSHGASNPEILITRENDQQWLDRNTAMIIDFAENTVLRLTRVHGIDDLEVY